MGPPMPPPMDPAAAGGGGGGLDPAVQNAIHQAVQRINGGAGGKGTGAATGKRAEQQLLDSKLWVIQYILCMIAEQVGLKLPPSVMIGPPPDPMALAAAQQDSAMGSATAGGGAMGQAPAPAPPPAPPDQAPAIQPIEPMPGGPPKMAVYDDRSFAAWPIDETARNGVVAWPREGAASWVSAARDRARAAR